MLNHPNRKAVIKKALGYYVYGVKDNNEALPYTPFVPGETPDEVFGVGWWTEFHSRKEVGQIYRPKEIVELNPSSKRTEAILQHYSNILSTVTKSGQCIHLERALVKTMEIQSQNVYNALNGLEKEQEALLLDSLNTLLGESRIRGFNLKAEEEDKKVFVIRDEERRKEDKFLRWISKDTITKAEIRMALAGSIPYVCELLKHDNSSESNRLLNEIAESSVVGGSNRHLFSSRVRDYVLKELRKEFSKEQEVLFDKMETCYIKATQRALLEAFNAGVLSYGGNRPLGVGEIDVLLGDKEAFIQRFTEANLGWKGLAEGVIEASLSKDIHQVVQAYLRDVDGSKKLGAFRNAEYKSYIQHEANLKAHDTVYQEIIHTESNYDNHLKRELLRVAALLNDTSITVVQANSIIKDKNKDKDNNLFAFYLKSWGIKEENIDGILTTTEKELYVFLKKEYEDSKTVNTLRREGKNDKADALKAYLDKVNLIKTRTAFLKGVYKNRVENIDEKLARYTEKLKEIDNPDKLMKLSEKSGVIAFQYQNQMNLKVANSFFSLNKQFYDKATAPKIGHP